VFPRQSSNGSVLSWVPSEICAGDFVGEGETEPKQIGEGTRDRTERLNSPEIRVYFLVLSLVQFLSPGGHNQLTVFDPLYP